MKRYIKSNYMGNTPDEFRKYLKTYLGDDLSDQDIEDMVNDAFPKNRKPEVLLTPELENQIYSEFPRKQADEICSLIECGYSVDNAIQTVLDDRRYINSTTNNSPKVPAGWEVVPEGNWDDGTWGTISKELPGNDGYVWIDMQLDDRDRRYFEITWATRNSDGTVGEISPMTTEPFFRLSNAVDFAEQKIARLYGED